MPFIDYKAILYVIKAVAKIFVAFGILAIVFIVVGLYLLGVFDKDYTVRELKDNYYKKHYEIRELRQYFKSIVPANGYANIEFEGIDEIAILHYGISIKKAQKDSVVNGSFWNLEIQTRKCDNILQLLGWSKKTLDTIKARLDKANCIAIGYSENGYNVGFKRCGMGMYSFYVPNQPIVDSLQSNYNDSCSAILVNDTLVLEYAGGVIGSQCFYNFD